MDDNLRREAMLRADEIDDLATKLATQVAHRTDRERWLGEIKDRTQLWRNLLGGALSGQEKPVNATDGSLDQYLPEWDKPSDQVAAEKGISVQMVEAVKVALENGGLTLKYPSDPQYHGQGWHKIPAGQALPPDWEERLKNGQPLQ